MTFTRCLNESGIVAYTRPDRCDCAVAFAPASGGPPPAEILEADDLFRLWSNAAALVGAVRTRSILFFPRIEQAAALSKAKAFVQHIIAQGSWGVFHYFSEPNADAGSISVPNGTKNLVQISQFRLRVLKNGSAQTPSTLDRFNFTWQSPLLRIAIADAKWMAEDTNSGKIFQDQPDVFIDFEPHHPVPEDRDPIVTLSGAWEGVIAADALPALPIGMTYSRLRSDDASNFMTERVLDGRIFHSIDEGTGSCTLALDPRDVEPTASLNAHRSRIHFQPGAVLQSHLRTDFGLSVLLKAAPHEGRALAPLVFDVVAGNLNAGAWTVQSDAVSFYLEGQFEFAGVKGLPAQQAKNEVEHRIVTGAVPTEFARAKIGDVLHFRGRRPGALKVETDLAPALVQDAADDPAPNAVGQHDDNLMHDGGGYVTTSWMTVTPLIGKGTFHAEVDNSPLFGIKPSASPNNAAMADDAPAPLDRKHLIYGELTPASFMPVFPWAGRRGSPAPPALQEGQLPIHAEEFLGAVAADEITTVPAAQFETTHLALRRRTVVRPPRAAPPSHEAGEAMADLPVPVTPGVTPQGIVGELVDVNGATSYARLKFGNPDSSTPNAGEFEITISQTNTFGPVYQDIQRALRADKLFLVFDRPTAEAAATVVPSGSLKMRKFELKLDLQAQMGGSVLIVKYFRDKSLKDLIRDPKLWGCKEHLAPQTEAKDVMAKVEILNDAEPPIKVVPSPLGAIWGDPNWQGVLALDLDPTTMPDLFEALRPGMVENKLRAHHAGLNFLPVKGADLKADALPRLGSAFGLVRYRKEGFGPAEPTTADKEPEDTATGARSYGFFVETFDVEFANSQVSKFKALVQTTFTHLFWDTPDAPDKKGKLKLVGSYESRPSAGGGSEDVFSLRTEKPESISFKNSWIDKFLVERAEFSVISSQHDTDEHRKVRQIVSFIGLSGSLTFKKFDALDMFGVEVKSISVDRFGLQFEYNPQSSGADRFKCGFRADSVRADIDFNKAKNSLLALLPLKLKGFRVAIDKLLDLNELGFVPINFDGLGGRFNFAFDLELDMGFLGKLSGVGKGLKLPMLLGWKAGGVGLGFGIQFPNWNGRSFEIGLQQFVAIRADRAQLKTCKSGNDITAIAIVLSDARLVFFGKEWPNDSDIDLALFVPASSGRKMSWALARRAEGEWLRYIAAGHRIKAPAGTAAREIIDSFKGILKGDDDTDPCALLPQSSGSDDGWTILGEFVVQELVHAWFVVCDHPSLYALRLELMAVPGFAAEALYRQISDDLGVFSAEVGLPDSLRTYQVGAATVRLPTFRVEVYTDGGFLVDLGFPWKNDYRRSFQLEIAIFLGSGGFYFGYTSAAAADILALEKDDFGFHPPDRNVLHNFQAVRAGIAMRAGIGRSLDVGILKGEASLTVFCGLEGAIAYEKKAGNRDPKLYGIKGYMGIMVHIWAEVSFIVLRAKAELCAYVMAGFEIRRVLARRTEGDRPGHYYLTLPVTLFAEVGLYVHVEVWVTIGCVRVKLFDLEFRGTWHFEERIGGFSASPYLLDGNNALDAPLEDAAPLVPFAWKADYRLFAEGEPLKIFAAILPCVSDPADLSNQPAEDEQFKPSVVVQPMLRVSDDFLKLAKFMVAWVLEADASAGFKVMRETVVRHRKELQDGLLWMGGTTRTSLPLANLSAQFTPTYLPVPVEESHYAAMPLWPGSSWRFRAAQNAAEPLPAITPKPMHVPREGGGSLATDGATGYFVDYLRALTDATLAEIERIVQSNWTEKQGPPDQAFLTWDDLWQKLDPAAPTPPPPAPPVHP